LVADVLRLLEPVRRGLLVDCTIGAGGHAEALLEAARPDARLIGIDLDEGNLELARQRLGRFGERVRLLCADFAEVPSVLAEAGETSADLILADLGVCSAQLDDPARGLSFQADGPLDMRLDRRQRRTAADLVNRCGERELADLIYRFGEERYSRRIARAVVAARPIEGTRRLAEVVVGAYPPAARRARRGVHPATRTFQALRIAVNDEMGRLERLLSRLPEALSVGGAAGIISFHSLEDRQVKRAFADWARTGAARLLTRKPVAAGPEEVARNPRSRSAKLRAIEKIAPGPPRTGEAHRDGAGP